MTDLARFHDSLASRQASDMDVSDSDDALTAASTGDNNIDVPHTSSPHRDTDPDADADADGEFVNAASDDDEDDEEPVVQPSTSAITEAKANPGLYGLRRSVSRHPSSSSLSFLIAVQSRSRDNGSVNSVSPSPPPSSHHPHPPSHTGLRRPVKVVRRGRLLWRRRIRSKEII